MVGGVYTTVRILNGGTPLPLQSNPSAELSDNHAGRARGRSAREKLQSFSLCTCKRLFVSHHATALAGRERPSGVRCVLPLASI
jgi:hypothetical protein